MSRGESARRSEAAHGMVYPAGGSADRWREASWRGARRGMRMASVRTRWTMVRGTSCEWKALVRIAQRSAAHNGVRRNMRMESVRTRRTMVCGEASEWQASERGGQRGAAQHANEKRQSAAHNGAQRSHNAAKTTSISAFPPAHACPGQALRWRTPAGAPVPARRCVKVVLPFRAGAPAAVNMCR